MNQANDENARAEEASRNYLAQSWWPQPPAQTPGMPQRATPPTASPQHGQIGSPSHQSAPSESWTDGSTWRPQPGTGPYQASPDSLTQHWPMVYAGPAPWSVPQPPVKRSASTLRSVGIGALGLLAGLLAALVLQDILAIAFLRSGGGLPLELGVLIGSFMPILAVVGAVLALLIDRNARMRRSKPDTADRG